MMTYKILFISILFFCNSLFAKRNGQMEDSLSTLEFSFVGDIMCHSTQFKYAKTGKDSFDFKPVFREIKPYFENSDVVVGNLETVVEVKGVQFSGYPVFNTPKEFLEGLRFADFDILSTANNHSYDRSERGVLSTLKHIKDYGFESVGSYSSKSSRDSVKVFEKNGIKFALLSYTYGVNLYHIPDEKSYLVNRINRRIIKSDISKHRSNGADVVILFFHFGLEYAKQPNSYQREVVEKSIQFGADVIIGSHSHSLQPIEYFKTKDGKLDSGFVAYSLGNFISNQRWRYSDGGAVLNFTITKNIFTGKISLGRVRFLPIWVYKGNTENGSEYIVLPCELAVAETTPSYLSSSDVSLMKECYDDTKRILTNYSTNVEIDSIEKSRMRRRKREYLANRILKDKIQIFQIEKKGINFYNNFLKYIKVDTTREPRIID